MNKIKIIVALLIASSMLLFAQDWKDGPATNQTFDTWMIEHISDDMIRALAKAGRICRVIGHVWINEPRVTLEFNPTAIGYRRCGVCGKTQTLRVRAWE